MTDTIRLLNRNEASELLRVHPATLDKYIADGKLKALKIGRIIRINQEDLLDFVNRGAETNPKESEVIK